jgi:uncharacterized protein (TIGR03083 family)
MTISFEAYCDVIGEEAERLGQAAESSFDAPVPSCPGWTVAELLAHVTAVYRMWIAQLNAKNPEERAPSPPRVLSERPVLSANFESASAELLAALADVTPDGPCWNFAGQDCNAAWVARRVAHESTIHRVDAELARGAPTAIDCEFAVDGIDERIQVLLPARLRHSSEASLGGTIGFVCTDADAAWVVSVESGRLSWRAGRGPVDAVVVGPSAEIYLFSWNRAVVDALALTGNKAVAEAWKTLPG